MAAACMAFSPLKKQRIAMLDVMINSQEKKNERELSAAQAWAKKRADQMRRAEELRAARQENTLGTGDARSFLDRLGAAEARDVASRSAAGFDTTNI